MNWINAITTVLSYLIPDLKLFLRKGLATQLKFWNECIKSQNNTTIDYIYENVTMQHKTHSLNYHVWLEILAFLSGFYHRPSPCQLRCWPSLPIIEVIMRCLIAGSPLAANEHATIWKNSGEEIEWTAPWINHYSSMKLTNWGWHFKLHFLFEDWYIYTEI